MILTCPTCSRRFQLDPGLLGAGRRVRCSNCRTVWHQGPPAASPRPATPAPAPASPPPPPPPPVPDPFDSETRLFKGVIDPFVGDEAAPEEPSWPRKRAAATTPPPVDPAILEARRARRMGLLQWGSLAATVVAAVGSLAMFRDPVVAAWPAAALLYEMVGFPVGKPGDGLDIPDATTVAEYRNIEGIPLLFIGGDIVNISQQMRPVPDILAMVVDEQGNLLQTRRIEPATRTLEPGGTLRFESPAPVPETETRRAAAARFVFAPPEPPAAQPAGPQPAGASEAAAQGSQSATASATESPRH